MGRLGYTTLLLKIWNFTLIKLKKLAYINWFQKHPAVLTYTQF